MGVNLEKSTGSGLDQLVDIITSDERLQNRISAEDIQGGAEAANEMNAIIVEAVKATGVAHNGKITGSDVRDINSYIRENHLERWTELHGDDEGNEETGFHLVQNDGANSRLFGKNAVNTVADGIYHLGFEIEGNRLLNEDGNRNVSLNQAADWMNQLLADDFSDAGSVLYEMDLIA